MKTIVSWNVNGVRSAYSKGLHEFIEEYQPSILCMQELKCQKPDFEGLFKTLFDTHTQYYAYANTCADRSYAGVGVISKEKPLAITLPNIHPRFNQEGRILQLSYSEFELITVYMPHGGRKKENLNYKIEVYQSLFTYLQTLALIRPVVICGDFNIAHQDQDVARFSQNRNNIMFTPEERAQLDYLQELTFTDCFRVFEPLSRQYTWWPYAFKARERNIGWRIDYIFTSEQLRDRTVSARIMPQIHGSDHCPIAIELHI